MSHASRTDLRSATVASQGRDAVDGLPPRRADVASLAREGVQLRGQAPVSALTRVAEELAPQANRSDMPAMVVWTMVLSMRALPGRAAQPWLHLGASCEMPLTCQRCLSTVPTPVSVGRDFRFVADEKTAEHEDEESDEDVLAVDRQFDLQSLLEDELLMALPLVPRHEACPTPLPPQDAGQGNPVPADDPPPDKPNPFAVLGRLKAPSSRGGRG